MAERSMVLVLKMNKSFETQKGPKQHVRDLLVKHTQNPQTILTLPGRKMLCVDTFKKSWPKATVLGIERLKEDWEEISQKMLCYNCDIRSYIELQKIKVNHLDLIFLDYFSFLNSSVEDDIKALLRNENLLHPNKSSILGITLMKSMRGESEETLNKMKTTIFDGKHKNRENSLEEVGQYLTHFMIDSTIDFPISFELLENIEYKADKNSSSMYFFCFKITKG